MSAILLIEDDPEYAETLAEWLVRQGHEVTVSNDGESAWQHLLESSFDIVITDIILPHLNGIELAEKAQNSNSSIKIIVMTGGGMLGPDFYLNAAVQKGFVHVLEKPFHFSQLAALL
jgi:DNA-binding NtrC family response regulator